MLHVVPGSVVCVRSRSTATIRLLPERSRCFHRVACDLMPADERPVIRTALRRIRDSLRSGPDLLVVEGCDDVMCEREARQVTDLLRREAAHMGCSVVILTGRVAEAAAADEWWETSGESLRRLL